MGGTGGGYNPYLYVFHVSPFHVTLRIMKTPTAERVSKHREALRAAGLRPIQIWVPDTRRKGFAANCRRQSRLLKDDPQEADVLAWMMETADHDGWS